MLCLALAPTPARADKPVGFLFSQRGGVDLERAGKVQRVHPGQELLVGDRVMTDVDSRVKIELNDGSTLSLGGHSTLILKQLSFEPQAKVFNGEIGLERGILRVFLSRRERLRVFRVSTPSAALLSAGAQWIIEAGQAGTAVFVLEGEVEVAGAGMLKRVSADQGIEVPPDGLPTTPARWGQARIERAIARTDVP
ncbi:MAG: FecR family protein [Pseudomonadota bacterium]